MFLVLMLLVDATLSTSWSEFINQMGTRVSVQIFFFVILITHSSIDPPNSNQFTSNFLLLYRVRYRLFYSLQVAVNGSHLLEYRHRLELKEVNTLAISGKVQIQAIGFIPSAVSKVTVYLLQL